jgi:hypothetical protein
MPGKPALKKQKSLPEDVSAPFFWNKVLPYKANNLLWWMWESVIHHMYFFVLFVMRQFSPTDVAWKLNLEKECGFMQKLFGMQERVTAHCAEGSMMLFAGIWFDTAKPSEDQLNWIGRTVMNFQHCEGIIHLWIILAGLAIIFILGRHTDKNTRWQDLPVPLWLRYSFFLAMLIETWSMCVPYMVLFTWSVNAFKDKHPVLAEIQKMEVSEDPFYDGANLGFAHMCFLWVSLLCIIFDGLALHKAFLFIPSIDSMGSTSLFGHRGQLLTFLLWVLPSAIFAFLLEDFNIFGGIRGPYSGFILEGLHNAFPKGWRWIPY